MRLKPFILFIVRKKLASKKGVFVMWKTIGIAAIGLAVVGLLVWAFWPDGNNNVATGCPAGMTCTKKTTKAGTTCPTGYDCTPTGGKKTAGYVQQPPAGDTKYRGQKKPATAKEIFAAWERGMEKTPTLRHHTWSKFRKPRPTGDFDDCEPGDTVKIDGVLYGCGPRSR